MLLLPPVPRHALLVVPLPPTKRPLPSPAARPHNIRSRPDRRHGAWIVAAPGSVRRRVACPCPHSQAIASNGRRQIRAVAAVLAAAKARRNERRWRRVGGRLNIRAVPMAVAGQVRVNGP